MKQAGSITVLAILAGLAMTPIACEKAGRRVVQTLADPSGNWVAVVDEVEYANGFLTSVADRVSVFQSASQDTEGTVVFSEDALPDWDKPTVVWTPGRLVITVSRTATVLHRDTRAFGLEIEVRAR